MQLTNFQVYIIVFTTTHSTTDFNTIHIDSGNGRGERGAQLEQKRKEKKRKNKKDHSW